jgi:hypothetical protein
VTFVHIPAWYLFYDLFAMFDAFTLRKNFRHLSWGRQLWLYITKKSGLVSHHIILFLFGYLLVAVSDNVYVSSGTQYLASYTTPSSQGWAPKWLCLLLKLALPEQVVG